MPKKCSTNKRVRLVIPRKLAAEWEEMNGIDELQRLSIYQWGITKALKATGVSTSWWRRLNNWMRFEKTDTEYLDYLQNNLVSDEDVGVALNNNSDDLDRKIRFVRGVIGLYNGGNPDAKFKPEFEEKKTNDPRIPTTSITSTTSTTTLGQSLRAKNQKKSKMYLPSTCYLPHEPPEHLMHTSHTSRTPRMYLICTSYVPHISPEHLICTSCVPHAYLPTSDELGQVRAGLSMLRGVFGGWFGGYF